MLLSLSTQAVRENIMYRSRTTLRSDVVRGVRLGLYFATLMTAYVIAARIFFNSEAVEGYGLSLVKLVLLYYGGGILVGALSGVLRPLNSTLGGSMLTGFVLWIPVTFIAATALAASSERYMLGSRLVPFTLILSAILGPLFGAIAWHQDRR
jgi:hypothetical protein